MWGGTLGRRWGFDSVMNGCNMCLPMQYQSHQIKGDEKSGGQFNRHSCFVSVSRSDRPMEEKRKKKHVVLTLFSLSAADNVVASHYGIGK